MMGAMIRFQDLDLFTDRDIEAALQRNDSRELRLLSITVALSLGDDRYAEKICLNLAAHQDNRVRGNAIVSLGHLARRFGKLREDSVKPVVENALQDEDAYVRASAKSAADEIHQFLHWRIAGHVYGVEPPPAGAGGSH